MTERTSRAEWSPQAAKIAHSAPIHCLQARHMLYSRKACLPTRGRPEDGASSEREYFTPGWRCDNTHEANLRRRRGALQPGDWPDDGDARSDSNTVAKHTPNRAD